jgi:hypothetical protein
MSIDDYLDIPVLDESIIYNNFAAYEATVYRYSLEYRYEVIKDSSKRYNSVEEVYKRPFKYAKGIYLAYLLPASRVSKKPDKSTKKTGCPFSVILSAINKDDVRGKWTTSLSKARGAHNYPTIYISRLVGHRRRTRSS